MDEEEKKQINVAETGEPIAAPVVAVEKKPEQDKNEAAAEKREKRVKKEKKLEEEVFDASGAVVGRLAALSVKKLLSGKRVVLLNAEKAVISGDPKGVVERYSGKRGMQNKSNPEHSPKWPRRPDFLYKKIVSGMLPKKPRGRIAFKNLRIYIGVPSEYAGRKAQQYAIKDSFRKSITLGEICERLGWKTL